MKTTDFGACILALLYLVLPLHITGQPANPDPVLPPGIDPNTGKLGLRRTAEHSLVRKLSLLFRHYTEKTGKTPRNWNELEQSFGNDVWESRDQWENIKRRFAFVATEGRIVTHEQGLVEGALLLAPLYSIRDSRSEEEGRFAVWKMSNGLIFEMWNTESELQTFSQWSEVTVKLEAAKAAVAQMTPLAIKSTPIPQPQAVPPIGSTPSANSNTTQKPAATIEHNTPAWPWLVGIAALIVIAWLVLKRRT